jgi:hypothetical protein
VEVQRELAPVGEQQPAQRLDPPRQQGLLVGPGAAVGVLGREGLLGRDVQAGEQAEGRLEVEVIDVTETLLVKQLQQQEG